MMKLNLIGLKFGLLTVVSEAEKKGKKVRWNCTCDCGRTTIASTCNLRNGHTSSCGCMCGRVDIVGKKFGKLLVMEKASGGKHKCRCDCGNIVQVITYNLNNSNTQSCGCLQLERASNASFINSVGKRFGKLTVIERVENNRYNHTRYKCRCDCGGEIITEGIRLRSGRVNSCGCIKSKGEMVIHKYLQEKKIKYQAQYSHDEIFFSSGRRPFFDFVIFNNDGTIKCLIEFNGTQHYGFTNNGWNTEENYLDTVRRDYERRAECARLRIPLHEIPYWKLYRIDEILDCIIEERA